MEQQLSLLFFMLVLASVMIDSVTAFLFKLSAIDRPRATFSATSPSLSPQTASKDYMNNLSHDLPSSQPLLSPRHVAFIVDGNGRWAQQRNLSRSDGHREGAHTSVRIVNSTFALGAQFITLYLLSTENWKRSVEEITNIFSLLDNYLTNYATFFQENKIEVQGIGQLDRLPAFTRTLLTSAGYQPSAIEKQVHHQQSNSRKMLTLAISYGGRDEITQACRQLALQVSQGKLAANKITEELITQHLFTGKLGIPDPDLIIRTSGEQRLSNFLLWQSAYSEFNSTKTLCKLSTAFFISIVFKIFDVVCRA